MKTMALVMLRNILVLKKYTLKYLGGKFLMFATSSQMVQKKLKWAKERE